MPNALILDAVIIGGGAAGLWTLDRLVARGYQALLLEAHALGSGQTIASQGIIHGGLKYTLSGMLTPSAKAIREMPLIWRECLVGKRDPKLTKTIVRSPHCYLWRTESVASRLGMIGARVGLRVAPQAIAKDDRPIALKNCPGTVGKIDEQVIDPASFIADLAQRHADRIVKIAFPDGVVINQETWGYWITVQGNHHAISIQSDRLILMAGQGNEAIRQQLGLELTIMQRRPLHMVMVRGRELPPLFGHCVDGAKTRITVSSAETSDGTTVWQIGGQIAEDGANMSSEELIQHARRELDEALAGFDRGDVEWATYRVNRAEHAAGGKRPDDVALIQEDTLITVWPTKLALAPRAAELVESSMHDPPRGLDWDSTWTKDWPKPQVALPPWETATQWIAAR